MRSKRKSRRLFQAIKKKKRKLFSSEPVHSTPYQYYYGRDQLKETYPDKIDDDYSYYHFPETRRDYYNKDFGRESFNIPDYYKENPFASAFVERYPATSYRKRNFLIQNSSSRYLRANEHQGIDRFRDSMDAAIYNNMLDELENNEQLPDAVRNRKKYPEYFGNGGGGFSRFGKYDEGKDEMLAEEGLGRRAGRNRYGKSGRRIFRKRK